MERTGQGAIEYLLIIGAAILVVAVVIIAMTSVTSQATENTGADDVNNALKPLCEPTCTNLGGTWDASNDPPCSVAMTGQCAIYGQ